MREPPRRTRGRRREWTVLALVVSVAALLMVLASSRFADPEIARRVELQRLASGVAEIVDAAWARALGRLEGELRGELEPFRPVTGVGPVPGEPGPAGERRDLATGSLAGESSVVVALLEELAHAWIKVLEQAEPRFLEQSLEALTSTARLGTARPLLAWFLEREDPELRNRAAWMLSRFPAAPELLELVDHADESLRFFVASCLDRQSIKVLVPRRLSGPKVHTVDHIVEPDWTAEARRVLVQLARDASPKVRQRVVSAARYAAEAIGDPGDEAIQILLHDEDPAVREHLVSACGVHSIEPSLAAAWLGQLARDEEPAVLEAVDGFLEDWIINETRRTDGQHAAFFPALAARLGHREQPFAARRGDFLMQLGRSRDGVRFLLRQAVGLEDLELFLAALYATPQLEGAEPAFSRKELGAYLRLTEAVTGDKMVERAWDVLYKTDLPMEGIVHVASSSDSSFTTRLRLLERGVWDRGGAAPLVEALVRLLSEPSDALGSLRHPVRRALDALGRHLQGSKGNLVLEQLLEAEVHELIQREITGWLDPFADGAETVAREVIERWLSRPVGVEDGLRRALTWVAMQERDPERLDILRRALAQPELERITLGILEVHKQPALVKEVSGILRGRSPFTSTTASVRQGVRKDAARVLASMGTEESRRALLEALPVLDNQYQLRDSVVDLLQQILRVEELQRSWEVRRSERREREDAVTELLGMLDDESLVVRVEAVRGLGSLGAVETLPRLIRLLEADEPEVRDAARESIDHLNRIAREREGTPEDGSSEREPDEEDESS